MYKFQCSNCLKEFKQSCNYNRHLNRKNPCKRVEKKEPHITTYNHLLPPSTTYNHITKNKELETQKNTDVSPNYELVEQNNNICETVDSKYIKCNYCSKKYAKKMLKRHLRNNCLYIPENKRKVLIEQYKNNKRHINKQNQLQIIENNKTVNSHNITNNTTNTNSHNTTNIQNNNNITIKINPFGQENIDLIPKDKQFKLLNRVFKMIPDTYRALYYDAIENRNMYIPNVNRPIVKVFDGDEWDLKSFDDVSDIVSNKMQDTIQEWSEKYNKKLSQSKQFALKNFIQKCIKGEMEKQMKNELKIFLMSFSNRIKENVDKEFNKLESLDNCDL